MTKWIDLCRCTHHTAINYIDQHHLNKPPAIAKETFLFVSSCLPVAKDRGMTDPCLGIGLPLDGCETLTLFRKKNLT